MFCPALSSFPKSVSKISASASKAAPSQVADIEHATRGAQPEACFDPLVTKAVAFIAASSCTPNELLAHCRPSSSVQGNQQQASQNTDWKSQWLRDCLTQILFADAQSLEDLMAMKDLCDTLSFSDDDDCCPPVPPTSRVAVYDFDF
jgi:hypothetical protein